MAAITNFEQLRAEAKRRGPLTVAVAAAQQYSSIEAAREACDAGIANAILVGDEEQIRKIAAENAVSLDGLRVIDVPEVHEAAREAVRLVHDGTAQILMKGKLETADLLRAALNKEAGLRAGALLTVVWVGEIPGFGRLLFISDPGVVIRPTIDQKVDIVQNAINVALRLGLIEPKVAVLAALDMVSPTIPTTVDAANLSKMADRGQITGGYVDGPLGFDTAISPAAALAHGLRGPVAGQADILIVPDIEAGNVLVKGLTYFAGAASAVIVAGARAPIVITSRADPPETKLTSIALAALLASSPLPLHETILTLADVQQRS